MRSNVTLLADHARIIWALILREIATRYGRNNIGFLWVFAEPMVFCVGVLILWRAIHGQYENGVSVVPFILTGYMPMILVRHTVSYSVNAIKINNALLYYRNVSILDLYIARISLEFIGVTLAGLVLFVVLFLFRMVPLPVHPFVVYEAWLIALLVSGGMALAVGAVSEIFEVVERIISVSLYIIVPLSGTFFLSDWLPPDARRYALLLPFLHISDMIRYGFFGSQVHPHYDVAYASLCGALMLAFGLIMIRRVRSHIEVY